MGQKIIQMVTLGDLSSIKLEPGDYQIDLSLPVQLSSEQVSTIESRLIDNGVYLLKPIQYSLETGVLTIFARQAASDDGVAFGFSDITDGLSDALGSLGSALFSPFKAIFSDASETLLVPVLVVAGIGLVLILATGWSASRVGNTKFGEQAGRSVGPALAASKYL